MQRGSRNSFSGNRQSTTSSDTQSQSTSASSDSQIGTNVEPSFFDELAKDTPLWISNPCEHPKVKNMDLSQQILYEGYLSKKSRDEQQMFKPRYFVLYEDRLEVFKDQNEAQSQKASNIMLLASVRLDLRLICDADLKMLDKIERYFLMFLSCKMRFFLFAQDADTQAQWIKHFKRTCILTNYSQTYENIKVLGRGTFAKVFLAKQIRSGGKFAVKTFDKKALTENKLSEKAKVILVTGLLNEIQILRKCDHPNIIKLFEVYESENYIYLVQNVLEGGELFETILKNGNFSEKIAAYIIIQLLSALDYIHAKNIMHRDIKPENLILVDKTDDFQIKLADFGLSAFIQDDLLFKRCGTPGYVAPEILLDKKYNQKVDIFSSGVILYILLTGCSPFYGENYEEILNKNKNCEISYDFSDIGVKLSLEAGDLLKKMLQVDPNKRISAQEALNHPFLAKTKTQDNQDQLNTSIDIMDTGIEESTAFDNMRNFQSKFNVQNIKTIDVKNFEADRDLVSMTPMLGRRILQNQNGEDILKESLMSPLLGIPGSNKQSDYMGIPETPVVNSDQIRNLSQINNQLSNANYKNVPTNSINNNSNNNNQQNIKDKLKKMI